MLLALLLILGQPSTLAMADGVQETRLLEDHRIFLKPSKEGVAEVVFSGGVLTAISIAYNLFKWAVYAIVAMSVSFCLLCVCLIFSMFAQGMNLVLSLFKKKT